MPQQWLVLAFPRADEVLEFRRCLESSLVRGKVLLSTRVEKLQGQDMSMEGRGNQRGLPGGETCSLKDSLVGTLALRAEA